MRQSKLRKIIAAVAMAGSGLLLLAPGSAQAVPSQVRHLSFRPN